MTTTEVRGQWKEKGIMTVGRETYTKREGKLQKQKKVEERRQLINVEINEPQ